MAQAADRLSARVGVVDQLPKNQLSDAAWQVFARSGNEREYLSAWLYIQCDLIANHMAGWLFERAADGGDLVLVARHRAQDQSGLTLAAHGLARAAADKRSGMIEEAPDRTTYLLAYPMIEPAAKREAVAVVAVGAAAPEALTQAMRQLQWGASALRNWFLRQRDYGAELAPSSASDIFKLFAATVEPQRFADAANALTTRLAHAWNMERVSLGMMRGRRVRIASISHVSGADVRMSAVRQLEEAMYEAIDQRSAILAPRVGADRGFVNQAAMALVANRSEGAAVGVFPISVQGQSIGALVLEKAGAFTDADIQRCDALLTLLGPVLQEKRLNDRWIVTKFLASLRIQVGKLLGPSHPLRKLVAVAVLGTITGAALIDAPYSVSAPAFVEAMGRRVVPAPFDGYLAQAPVRAGDHVKAGVMLAAIDDRDIALERLGLLADREQRRSELQQATAAYDLAKAKMLRAEVNQIEAKLQLVEARLARAVVRAPIDGLVLAGDLSQSIGEPVKLGTPLFEIAPAGAFRIVTNVDERDIEAVTPGQTGRVVLAALPEQTFAFAVERVSPLLEASGGRNFYRVEGKLETDHTAFRAGLEGRARIEVGERRLIWQWTHQMLAWARLQMWTWLP